MDLRKFLPKRLLVIVLLWTLSSFIPCFYITYTSRSEFVYSYVTATITFPLAGWLADVYFGRYKVIHYSLWLEVVASISCNAVLLAEPYMDDTVTTVLLTIMAVVLTIGVTGVTANTMQFGLDQLFDASSSDISSYIDWYSWTAFLASIIVEFSQNCSCRVDDTKVTFIIIPLFCTLALSFDLLANKQLLKEPITHNPLKLIFKVLRYAAKNKHPHMRSAFTYWEDKPYSRMDLGKSKYGGPFTTEQVEDVKAFLRIFAVILSSSVGFFLINLTYLSIHDMMYHMTDFGYIYCEDSTLTKFLTNCYKRDIVVRAGEIAVVILIPLAKLGSYTNNKWFKFLHFSIFTKLTLGIVLLLLYTILLLAVEITGIFITHHNFTCLLVSDSDDLINGNVLDLNYSWLLIPQLLFSLATCTIIQNGLALLCSQVPYSMRGLLIGVLYYAVSIFIFLSQLSYSFLQQQCRHKNQKYCGLWFFSAVVLVTAVYTVTMSVIKKCYVFRRRDEDIHNEHIFAVNYYDKYLPKNTSLAERIS